MLLTITYTGENTQDIGYLLFKHPGRIQRFRLSFSDAYVFYPVVSDKETTAALLLDTDPLILAKGKAGSREGGLFDYVNDRPYVSSSFMSTAIARVFGTAMNGRCDARLELAGKKLSLSATVHSLRVGEDRSFVEDVFSPLGYEVSYGVKELDCRFPGWGDSPYIDLTIKGRVRLSELLRHLYVLIPVFDGQKHYYMNRDEIDKILLHGKGWLDDHPERDRIIRRYFGQAKSYAREVIIRLDGREEVLPDENKKETASSDRTDGQYLPLDRIRLEAVRDEVISCGASSVLDLGCGEGKLLELLMKEDRISKITGADVSLSALEWAARRLHMDKLPDCRKKRLSVFQASAIYKDLRFRGYDAVCAVEVIEHIEPDRLASFEYVVFACAVPETVILTTPNREYNVNYPHIPYGGLRHPDHRFEWTREEFGMWISRICTQYGYTAEIKGIGEADSELGSPTQMAVFTKKEGKV